MAANTLPAAISIHSFLLPCDLPPLPSEGEGWGEGGSTNYTTLIFPQKHKATPILAFPRQTGEGTELLLRRKGRLKPKSCFQTTFLISKKSPVAWALHTR